MSKWGLMLMEATYLSSLSSLHSFSLTFSLRLVFSHYLFALAYLIDLISYRAYTAFDFILVYLSMPWLMTLSRGQCVVNLSSFTVTIYAHTTHIRHTRILTICR